MAEEEQLPQEPYQVAFLDGIRNWFSSESGKEPELKYAKAPPIENYPDENEVNFAKQYGFYEDMYEPYSEGKLQRVLGEEFNKVIPGPKKGQTKTVSETVALAANQVEGGNTRKLMENLDKNTVFAKEYPELADIYAKGRLVSNRIPLASLGFDPEKTTYDVKIGNDVNIAGLYSPSSDRIYVNSTFPGTLVHESIHRGIALVRKQDPEFFKTLKLPDEESTVRYLMATQAGDPESKFRGDATLSHAQRKAALEAYKRFPAYVDSLERLSERAAKLIAERRPGGPR